jgi:hypothetical protein
MQTDFFEIIAVERDIKGAERDLDAKRGMQALCHPNAAGMNTNNARVWPDDGFH